MNYQKSILDKVKMSFKLRELIVTSPFTREELANMLELTSPRVIYDWECGKKLPNVENLYNLSLIFNLKMEDLLIIK